MGTVITIQPDDWLVLKLIKDNIEWYAQQKKDFTVASKLEKKLFRKYLDENSSRH
jgi:hypothetical protein